MNSFKKAFHCYIFKKTEIAEKLPLEMQALKSIRNLSNHFSLCMLFRVAICNLMGLTIILKYFLCIPCTDFHRSFFSVLFYFQI